MSKNLSQCRGAEIVRAVGVAVGGCALVIGAGACSAQHRPPSSSVTSLVHASPVDAAGKARPGYSITRVTGKTVDCLTPSPSAVRVDVVACGSTADDADVCWVEPDRAKVLCEISPWDKELREFTSSGMIHKMTVPAQPLAWAVVLQGGDKCVRRIGGAVDSLPFGIIPAYYCQDQNRMIVVGADGKLFDKSSARWTVQTIDEPEAVKAGSAYKLPPRESVVTAYFAD